MAQLEIEVVAKVDKLVNGMSDAQRAIKQFDIEAGKINKSLKANAISAARLQRQIEGLNADFKNGVISQKQFKAALASVAVEEKALSAESKRLIADLRVVNNQSRALGGGVKNLGQNTANAVPAMTEFSRVIQDAPFGIRGVANNIQQLTATFGHLQKSAGGTKKAFSAMLGTLAGPGGILLIVSIVTSLMVVFADKFDYLGGKVKSADDKLEDYLATLKGVAAATLEGEKSAQKELTTFGLLRKQAEDLNGTMESRLKAVKDLKTAYPGLLKDVKDEAVLSGELATSYDLITESILRRARAKAAEDAISANSAKILGVRNQLESVAIQNALDRLYVEKLTNDILHGGIVARQTAEASIVRVQGRLTKGLKEQVSLIEDVVGLQKENEKLTGQVIDNGGIADGSGGDNGGGGDSDGSKARKAFQNKLKVMAFYNGLAEKQMQDNFDKENKATADFHHENALITETAEDRKFRNAQRSAEREAARAAAARANALIAAEVFTSNLNDILADGLTDGITDLANAIGQAFAEGDNVAKKGGEAVLATLGGILQKFGSLVLATGVASEAFKKAITNPFGGGIAAIAAGAALIAIGGAVKGFAKNLGASGAGESAAGGSETPSSGYGFTEGGLGNTIVLTVEGTQLIGVINNTTRQDISLGGSIGL